MLLRLDLEMLQVYFFQPVLITTEFVATPILHDFQVGNLLLASLERSFLTSFLRWPNTSERSDIPSSNSGSLWQQFSPRWEKEPFTFWRAYQKWDWEGDKPLQYIVSCQLLPTLRIKGSMFMIPFRSMLQKSLTVARLVWGSRKHSSRLAQLPGEDIKDENWF